MSSPVVKKLKAGRTECTVTFTEVEIAPAEQKALHELSRDIQIEGFRKGNAPMDMVREKINPQKLFELTIHYLLPSTFESLVQEHDIKPVIQPHVSVESKEPLTLTITFVEKPEVSLKGIDKIRIEKREPSVDPKDLQSMIDYLLDQHKTVTAVERPSQKGDRITMNFWGADADGAEIDGIRTDGHQVEIGSNTLIPGFEEELTGLKKGDEKSFTITFPEKYHAEHLQKKPVTFHVTVTHVEEVKRPELTDAFAKAQLHAESVDDLKKQIEQSMLSQEQALEHQRRERLLMEEIAKCTKVELAPELVDEETRQMIGEFDQQLQRQNLSLDTWLKQSGKKAEEVMADFKKQAEQRLTVRLGVQKLVEDKNIDVTDEEMDQIVDSFLAQATPEQRKEVEPAYQKGAQAYEQLKWQTKVEKVLKEMLK